MKAQNFTPESDASYFTWMKENPEGYVLNVPKGASTRFFMIHRSGCSHIAWARDGKPTGGYTQKDWIKVCSMSIEDLRGYVLIRGKGQRQDIRYCKDCKFGDEAPLDEHFYPDDLTPDEEILYGEGGMRPVMVNYFERNPKARRKCIEIYGTLCAVCDLDMEVVYGRIGRGFVHVHHLKQISNRGGEYEVDPKRDLRPVCPNCHAMLHLGQKEPRTIEELKEIMEQQRSLMHNSPPPLS